MLLMMNEIYAGSQADAVISNINPILRVYVKFRFELHPEAICYSQTILGNPTRDHIFMEKTVLGTAKKLKKLCNMSFISYMSFSEAAKNLFKP